MYHRFLTHRDPLSLEPKKMTRQCLCLRNSIRNTGHLGGAREVEEGEGEVEAHWGQPPQSGMGSSPHHTPQSRKRPFSWQQSPALHLSAFGALQQGNSLDFIPARRWGHCSCSLTLVTHNLAFMGCTEESMINAHSVMMHGTGPILQMPSPPPRVSQTTASR